MTALLRTDTSKFLKVPPRAQQFPCGDMRHDAEARHIVQDDRREVPEGGDRAQEGQAAGKRPHLQQGARLPLLGEGQALHQGTHAALCVSNVQGVTRTDCFLTEPGYLLLCLVFDKQQATTVCWDMNLGDSKTH